MDRLVDSFGRVANYLRISAIDRYNLRCQYCMPDGAPWVPRKQILIFKEIVRFGRVMTQLSVTKVRLTGGEPLVRRGLPELIERWTRNISRIEG
jgi:cyclic pyranopterin phosphate synthase